MKKSLAVLIVFALFVSVFAALSAQTVLNVKAQAASDISILSYRWYVVPSSSSTLAEYIGDVVAVGEVQNTGSTAIGDVVLIGSAYASNGTDLCDVSIPIQGITQIGPQEKVPFYMDFSPENSATQDQSWVSNVTSVNVSVATISNVSQTHYSGLTIPSSTLSGAVVNDTYTLTGLVENTGTQTRGNTWVVATFYNSTGQVLEMGYTNFLTTSLSPGSTVSFSISPVDNTAELSSAISNYSVIVESEAPTTTAATSTPTQTTTQPTYAGSTGPTATPIASSINTTYILVGVVAVLVVVLVAMLLLRSRRKTTISHRRLRRHLHNNPFFFPKTQQTRLQ